MKTIRKNPLSMKTLLLAGSCLALGLAAGTSRAALLHWVPQGSQPGNNTTANLSGTWESASWSTSTSTIVKTSWIDSSYAANIGMYAGGGTPAYTITMTNTHTVAGFFVAY